MSVTVVMPIHRGGELATMAAFAAMNQDHPPVSLILIDDTGGRLKDRPLWAYAAHRMGWEIVPARPTIREGFARLGSHYQHAVSLVQTEWLWWVEEDVIPEYDCLGILLGEARRHGLAAVHPRYPRLGAEAYPGIPSDAWMHDPIGGNGVRLAPWTQTGALLVRSEVWASLDFSGGDPVKTGADLHATAQIAKYGLAIVPRATAYHWRVDDPPYVARDARLSISEIESWLRPVLGEAEWDDFLGRIAG